MTRFLPRTLGGLGGLACLLCCVIPVLLAAGVIGGAGWVALGQILPGIAVVLVGLAALAWWWTKRRPVHAAACAGGECGCGQR